MSNRAEPASVFFLSLYRWSDLLVDRLTFGEIELREEVLISNMLRLSLPTPRNTVEMWVEFAAVILVSVRRKPQSLSS